MARSTKRPRNVCNSCGDTWHPRGRDLSTKCPSCGSSDVQIPPLPPLGPALAASAGGCLLLILVACLVGICIVSSSRDDRGSGTSLVTPSSAPAASAGPSATLPRRCGFWVDGQREETLAAGTVEQLGETVAARVRVILSDGRSGWINTHCLPR